jgi:hypothetical protein
MLNPLAVATQGKGFLPMLLRGRVIASRYGFTAEKMDAALTVFLETLSQFAGSVTFPVTASALAANPAAAKKYARPGLELAIHGLHHVDYTQLSLEQQWEHVRQARDIFQRLGLLVAGFRCPYLRWNANTLTVLKEMGFVYDSSQALAWEVVGNSATDAYRRVLDFYGAESVQAFPALPAWSDALIRIPYCLPDDEALVDRLHLTNAGAMADIWLAMLAQAYQTGELFTLGLHPERALVCQAALEIVLVKARGLSPRVWVARLDEIAAWFRALGETTFEMQSEETGLYEISLIAPGRATVLVRSVEVRAVTQPWMGAYQAVAARNFTLRSDKRPLVGLAPGSPASLSRFLRHQGYLVETSAASEAYAVYLNRRSFGPADERPLLAELERGQWPVVRLARWPEAARCALAITGDVDAFTLWDYARRVLVER